MLAYLMDGIDFSYFYLSKQPYEVSKKSYVDLARSTITQNSTRDLQLFQWTRKLGKPYKLAHKASISSRRHTSSKDSTHHPSMTGSLLLQRSLKVKISSELTPWDEDYFYKTTPQGCPFTYINLLRLRFRLYYPTKSELHHHRTYEIRISPTTTP